MQPVHAEHTHGHVSIFVGPIATLQGRASFGTSAHPPQWKRFGVMVVEGKRVVALAHDLTGLDPKMIEKGTLHHLAPGQLLIPAFHDAHNHPHAAGTPHLSLPIRCLIL